MSLILEALRRSEAERRRGAPPRLLDPGEPVPRHRPSPWPMALAGLLGGLLLAGGAAWWWRGAQEAAAADLAPPASAPPPPQAPPPWVSAQRDAIPAAAYAPAPLPEPAPAPAAAAPAPSPAPPPAVAPAPAPPTADAEALEPARAATGPMPGDLPLGELPGAARESLPALRVSMHVYADDPARRFAIVDGQRRREGDPIGAGLQLVEIRRDGLRLAWQGRTLWVAR